MKQVKIWDWLGRNDNYQNGVTNKQVLEHFGNSFKIEWNKLKKKKSQVFYEDGKWFRWQTNKL